MSLSATLRSCSGIAQRPDGTARQETYGARSPDWGPGRRRPDCLLVSAGCPLGGATRGLAAVRRPGVSHVRVPALWLPGRSAVVVRLLHVIGAEVRESRRGWLACRRNAVRRRGTRRYDRERGHRRDRCCSTKLLTHVQPPSTCDSAAARRPLCVCVRASGCFGSNRRCAKTCGRLFRRALGQRLRWTG